MWLLDKTYDLSRKSSVPAASMCNWEYCLCLLSTSWHCWESPLSDPASPSMGVWYWSLEYLSTSCPSPLQLNHDLVKSISPPHPAPFPMQLNLAGENTQQSRTSPFRSMAAPSNGPLKLQRSHAALPLGHPQACSPGVHALFSLFRPLSLLHCPQPLLLTWLAIWLRKLKPSEENVPDSHQCVCNYLHLWPRLSSLLWLEMGWWCAQPEQPLPHGKPLPRLERPCCCRC